MLFFMEMKNKVRRKRVNWYKIMLDLGNSEIEHEYILYTGRLYCGKHLSYKRCAYYALKKYYSTTTIDQLLKKVGVL